MKLKHKTLQIALLAPALIFGTFLPTKAAAPSFATSAKPAGAAPSSSPAPAPIINSNSSAAQPSSGTARNTASAPASAPGVTPGPAPVSAQTVTNQALKQNVMRNANNFTDSDNSVQSFFQCAPVNVSSTEIERRQTAEYKTSGTEFSLKKAAFHTLDNIGVPMFTGRTDSQLAPGITRAYVDPPMPSLGKSKDPDQIQKLFSQEAGVAGGKPSNAPKIPLSELEGTGFDTVPDATAEIHNALPETHAKTK